jgi:hypothetical protein|eukprot:6809666-Prymnesium_polylepis.1
MVLDTDQYRIGFSALTYHVAKTWLSTVTQRAMRETTERKRLETRITELEQLLATRETDLARVTSDAKYSTRARRSSTTATAT